MRQTWKEKANQVLSNLGQKIPVYRDSQFHWGEVELPECLRAELEGSDGNSKENK